ncbi:hypothetical protein CISG_07776 [Coccidioides immitis RMSCC 3703]|uniref:Uncharacterized protein n=1 Tax=Coccidioides immitis RMSCC 3703 TaxID=454286 RepID=A0A0J8TZE5_COCIT|nr:hypothetical protein CISG_07776 [Coccidioides immitis RMSCC 3703]
MPAKTYWCRSEYEVPQTDGPEVFRDLNLWRLCTPSKIHIFQIALDASSAGEFSQRIWMFLGEFDLPRVESGDSDFLRGDRSHLEGVRTCSGNGRPSIGQIRDLVQRRNRIYTTGCAGLSISNLLERLNLRDVRYYAQWQNGPWKNAIAWQWSRIYRIKHCISPGDARALTDHSVSHTDGSDIRDLAGLGNCNMSTAKRFLQSALIEIAKTSYYELPGNYGATISLAFFESSKMNRVARPRPELATSGRFRPRFWDFRRGALTTHLKITSIAPYFMLIHSVLSCPVRGRENLVRMSLILDKACRAQSHNTASLAA